MIDGVVFDKDGTLFDFRQSWGGWAARMLALLAQDPPHAVTLATAIGYYPDSQDFHPKAL